MSLQMDLDDPSIIVYQGRPVGKIESKDGVTHVNLNLTYSGDPDDALVPISWFALALSHLERKQQRAVSVAELTVHSDDEDIDQTFVGPRMLTERTIKQGGYVWMFHKTDVDPWPSPLHGHDYDKNIKLDALSGNIYDVATKKLCATLKARKLADIQNELRQSKDFADRVAQLLGD